MPRYFLHVKDGSDLLQDLDGQEFDDLTAAKQEAIGAVRDLMAECLRCGRPLGLSRAMVIADENGATLAMVLFESALPTENSSS
jgi:hypothetical protein